MTESHLLDLVERLYKDCNNYCVICLRTDKERRLEPAKHLKRYIQSLGQPFNFDRPFQMVCYVCERQAASAYRFRLATQAAAQAHMLVHQLVMKPRQREKLASVVKSNMMGNKPTAIHPSWLKDMVDCENNIRRQRMLSQLINTEMLIVSTNETDQCSRQGESRDLYVIPDASPTETCDLDIKLEVPETIVILDETELKIDHIPVIDPDNIHTNTIEAGSKKQSNIEENIHEKLFIATPVVKLDNTILNNSPINFFLHPIVIEGDNITVPSLSADIKDGTLITHGNLQMATPQIAIQDNGNISLISEPSQVIFMLQKLTRNEGSLKSEVQTMASEVRSDSEVAKPPQFRCDRIDWEDKIPMDVISFVNDEYDKDICKRSRKMPKIGISNVTSLDPQSNVIDLC